MPPTIKAAVAPETVLEGHTDLMYLCNKQVIVLITVYKPTDLVFTQILKGTGKEEKKAAFADQIGLLKAAGFEISKIHGDAGDGY